jgi:hypothetical protein
MQDVEEDGWNGRKIPVQKRSTIVLFPVPFYAIPSGDSGLQLTSTLVCSTSKPRPVAEARATRLYGARGYKRRDVFATFGSKFKLFKVVRTVHPR